MKSDTPYWDPIYGAVALDPIVYEAMEELPELARLRLIGMMNFRSKRLIALTNISRLEHVVGITHLCCRYSDRNGLIPKRRKELVLAALLHDVNCGPFGHAVEWAISRHCHYDHEDETGWLKQDSKLSGNGSQPMFFDYGNVRAIPSVNNYKLDLDFVDGLITGSTWTHLNSSGVDLDNIDNVFRMAFYMGDYGARVRPQACADAMCHADDKNCPVFTQEGTAEVENWLRVRSEVYERFIYDPEYLAFEALLFKLIEAVVASQGPQLLRSWFHYTDEHFLRSCLAEIDGAAKGYAKDLLLHRLPEAELIFRIPYEDAASTVRDPDSLTELEDSIGTHLGQDLRRYGFVHSTTDLRKTHREIKFRREIAAGTSEVTRIGDEANFVVLAVLLWRNASVSRSRLREAVVRALESCGYQTAQEYGETTTAQGQLL